MQITHQSRDKQIYRLIGVSFNFVTHLTAEIFEGRGEAI